MKKEIKKHNVRTYRYWRRHRGRGYTPGCTDLHHEILVPAMEMKGWHNGGTEQGYKLSEIRVTPTPNGIIEARLPGCEDLRCVPIKNIAGSTITVHCTMTGRPIQIRPVFLTMLEPIKEVKVEKAESEIPKETA